MLAPGFNRWGQVLLHFGTSTRNDAAAHLRVAHIHMLISMAPAATGSSTPRPRPPREIGVMEGRAVPAPGRKRRVQGPLWRELGMRIPIGKLFCELHIDGRRPVVAVEARRRPHRLCGYLRAHQGQADNSWVARNNLKLAARSAAGTASPNARSRARRLALLQSS